MKTVRNVLVFSQEYPPYSWGGVTPFTVNIVNGLSSLGITVNLMTICEKEGVERQKNGVNLYRIPASGIYKDEYIDTSEGLKRHLRFLKKAKQLAQEMGKPDVVILSDGLCFPEAKAFALHYNIPLITMVNQVFADINELWDGKLSSMMKLENQYFEKSTHLVVGSHYMKTRMDILGFGDKTTQINYGWGFQNWIDNNTQPLPYSDFVFVGRMVPEKGILLLLEAFNEAVKQCPNISLKLIGDGPMKEVGMQKVKEYGIEKNVSFLGSVPWTQVFRAFQSAKYSIVPSLNEPFGYVALEMLMYGGIPIVSDACGLREIANCVPYDCKIPVREEKPFIFLIDVRKLSEKIVELYGMNEGIRKKINHTARINASKEYNFVTVASQWVKLIESLRV